MNTVWSSYIQSTEELYESRALRFNDSNKRLWIDAIGAKPGERLLEIGCGGGIFCHRVKTYLPDVSVTGIDLDAGHIAFARKKAEELRLDCRFEVGDATALPFCDESFDLCFSHTVAEHIPHDAFFGEQRRVLRPGGRIAVLSVRTKLNIKFEETVVGEEAALIEKAWKRASETSEIDDSFVGAYELSEHEYPRELEKYGFSDVRVSVFTVMDYSPDSSDVTPEIAKRQINCRRLSALASLEKALKLRSDALNQTEVERLRELINSRFDERIAKYERGEKLWDFSTSTVLAVSGRKG